MVKYMGMKFKNYEELKEWNKQGHIEWYKTLTRIFVNHPTMEASCKMFDAAEILRDIYGMTPAEVEDIEIEVMKSFAQ